MQRPTPVSILTLLAILATLPLTPLAAKGSTAKGSTAKQPLTIEAIFGDSRSLSGPSELRWSPDGRLSFFKEIDAGKNEAGKNEGGKNKDGGEKDGDEKGGEEEEGEDPGRDLWILDVATGERSILLPDAELRRMAPTPDQAGVDERERTRRTRFEVGAYYWSPDGGKLLFTSTGQIWLYTLATGEAELRAPSKKGVLDPKFSPDGQWISFVHNHDIWVVPVENQGKEGRGKEVQLTTGGHDLLLHGDLDWVYPEEFGVRTGYHWSPDSAHIAFLEMDESPVPTYPIPDLLGAKPTVDLQRYPRAGDPNPKVRVGIVNLENKRTAWLDRHAEYIPRIDWASDDRVAVQLLNRGQDELELVLAEPTTGRSRSVFFERDKYWVDVENDLTFLSDGERFIWTSERTGLRHIYLMHTDGQVLRQLTDGEFQVSAVVGVDEDASEGQGWVYFTANADTLLGLDLYRVHLDGSGRERLTNGKGTHRITMNPEATAYLDDHSSRSLEEVDHQDVVDVASGKATEMFREYDVTADFDLVEPEHLELRTEDGDLVRVLLFKPPKLKRGKKYPVVVYVYGMPGFPTIRDRSITGTRNLFHQMLVQEGFIVAQVDDRSSSIPGHKYAVQADHNIGPLAAEDHRFAVEHLRTLPYVDGERMAVWGWSGGGFSTSYHLARTDLFKIGIAGAPVTDWRLYDSIYTERYMGHPEEDPEAYDRTSAVKGVSEEDAGERGRLLLIHGTHDDNVHPQNTIQMMDALIRAREQFDLMMYPNKTHGIRGKNHTVHLYTMIRDYLVRHLMANP